LDLHRLDLWYDVVKTSLVACSSTCRVAQRMPMSPQTRVLRCSVGRRRTTRFDLATHFGPVTDPNPANSEVTMYSLVYHFHLQTSPTHVRTYHTHLHRQLLAFQPTPGLLFRVIARLRHLKDQCLYVFPCTIYQLLELVILLGIRKS
jgi:hypothetical protein